MQSIRYQINGDLDLDKVIELYNLSTLGERRPIHHRGIMRKMIQRADLIVSAWWADQLVGICRTLTDFAYVAYVADLAVHLDFQHKGIGKELIRQTELQLEDTCFLTLLAAPKAQEYYGKVGFQPHPRAWIKPARSKVY